MSRSYKLNELNEINKEIISTMTGLEPAIPSSEVGCHIHSATEVGGAGPKVRKEN